MKNNKKAQVTILIIIAIIVIAATLLFFVFREEIHRKDEFGIGDKKYNCTFVCEGEISLNIYTSARDLARKIIEKKDLEVPFSITIEEINNQKS